MSDITRLSGRTHLLLNAGRSIIDLDAERLAAHSTYAKPGCSSSRPLTPPHNAAQWHRTPSDCPPSGATGPKPPRRSFVGRTLRTGLAPLRSPNGPSVSRRAGRRRAVEKRPSHEPHELETAGSTPARAIAPTSSQAPDTNLESRA